jgi:hypothetical protein
MRPVSSCCELLLSSMPIWRCKWTERQLQLDLYGNPLATWPTYMAVHVQGATERRRVSTNSKVSLEPRVAMTAALCFRHQRQRGRLIGCEITNSDCTSRHDSHDTARLLQFSPCRDTGERDALLHRLQNDIARPIFQLESRDHVSSYLIELPWYCYLVLLFGKSRTGNDLWRQLPEQCLNEWPKDETIRFYWVCGFSRIFAALLRLIAICCFKF